jgi:hypothetical protein
MNIREIVEVLAIPFFFALSLYFYNIPNKTPIEYVFYIFSISGFIVDLSLTLLLVRSHCRKVCKSRMNNSK